MAGSVSFSLGFSQRVEDRVFLCSQGVESPPAGAGSRDMRGNTACALSSQSDGLAGGHLLVVGGRSGPWCS